MAAVAPCGPPGLDSSAREDVSSVSRSCCQLAVPITVTAFLTWTAALLTLGFESNSRSIGAAIVANAGASAAAAAALPWRDFTATNVTAAAQSPLTAHIPSWVFAPMPSPTTDCTTKVKDLLRFSRSQGGEDLFAFEAFFPCARGGRVVFESGGYNGRHLSNSALFEDGLGWRSVLLEASPHNYKSMVAYRPAALNINAAICGEVRLVHYVGDAQSAVSGIWEFMEDSFRQDWWAATAGMGGDAVRGADGLWQLPSAAHPLVCRPMGGVFQMFGVSHVDFWSLDLEGGELQALQSWDFSKVTVDVIAIEWSDGTKEGERSILALLSSKGFALITTTLRSAWFVRTASGIADPAGRAKAVQASWPHGTDSYPGRGPCVGTMPGKARVGICDD
jgi:hypothetical protein